MKSNRIVWLTGMLIPLAAAAQEIRVYSLHRPAIVYPRNLRYILQVAQQAGPVFASTKK